MQSIQLSTLINACNEEDKNLKAKMDRYLEASGIVVFINNGSIKDVFGVLQDHNKRQKYISMIPKNQTENLEEYVLSLQELNATDNVSNFDSLRLEFNNLNYTVDDSLNLKRYNSLNLISYEKGYWAGITALPKPL